MAATLHCGRKKGKNQARPPAAAHARTDNAGVAPSNSPPSPAASAAHPYESLTPDVVLDALAALDLHGDGRLHGTEFLREPRLPGPPRRPQRGGRQVLPARPLERRADPRGARLRARTGGGRSAGRGADRGRRPHAAPPWRLRLQRQPLPRRPRARARRLRGARMGRPLPGAHPRGRCPHALRDPPGARSPDLRPRLARLAAGPPDGAAGRAARVGGRLQRPPSR